jgi:hypothetical protein
VLLLIGETDDDGLPTGTRTLVSASYSAEQELSRGGELLGLNAIVQEGELGSTLEFNDGVSVILQNMQSLSDLPDVPAGQQVLLFDLDVIADTESIATNLWQIELVYAGGQVYLPNTTLLQYASYGTLPDEISAFARISSSLAFLVPQDFPGGRLLISDGGGQRIAFRFALEQPELSVEYDGLDVRLVSVTTIEGQITTHLRIYNGQTTVIDFMQDDIWLSLGYAPDPPGPRNPAEGLQPFTLLPEQAVDLTLVWYWGAEPYAALQIGNYRFSIQLAR